MATSRRWWVFAIVSLALFMGMLDNLVVTTALSSIQKSLHASVADLEWTINAYTLAFTILMIPAAALGDRIGHRTVLLAGVALFTLGSVGSALSTTGTTLALARAVQGVGGAAITPLTLTILVRAFPERQRAAALGLWSGVSGLGLAMGPLIGGIIVNGLAWNAVFWVNVPIGALLLVLGAWQLPNTRGVKQPFDYLGSVLVGLGLLGVVYGLIRGNSLGWTSPQILAALIGGGVGLAAFVVRERFARAPMLSLSLFRSRGFSVANVVGFVMSFGMFGIIWLITLYIQQVQGASPLRAGLETMPWTGTIMLTAPLAGILAGRVGSRPLVVMGMAAQAIALARIAAISTPTTPYADLLPAFILGGLGMGLSFAPLSAAVMYRLGEDRQGQASSAYNTIRELGGVFGISVLGAIFQHIVTGPTLFMTGFHTAVVAGACILAGGTGLALLLPGRAAAVALPAEMVASAAAE